MNADIVRGSVLHCSRFGAVVRLEDGRLALFPSDREGMSALRRASTGGRRPEFPFVVEEDFGRRVRIALAEGAGAGDAGEDVEMSAVSGRSGSLEQKIIDYLRQSAERDPRAAAALAARTDERGNRVVRFEQRERGRAQNGEDRSRRPKR